MNEFPGVSLFLLNIVPEMRFCGKLQKKLLYAVKL